MKIISKFHDYYDIGLSYGVDPMIVYDRKKKTISIDHSTTKREKNENTKHFEIARNIFSGINRKYLSLFNRWRKSEINDLLIQSCGCICFCGEIHPFLECVVTSMDQSYYRKSTVQYVYSLNTLDKLIEESGSKRTYDKYFNSDKSEYTVGRSNYDVFFNHSKKASYESLVDLHIEYDSPIFIYEYESTQFNTIINPMLKKYEFYKVYDAYTTFQNLSMFMSGILGSKENKTVNVEDNDLKYMKGFDEKSFRKEPTKRKK